MLAQNFKTAANLGISDKQQGALIKTLVLLETGKLLHVPMGSALDGQALDFSGQFNMNQWGAKNKCGSICCIGGTAELVGALRHDELLDAAARNRKLRNLFYPDQATNWHKITVEQAATALRSYLTTGDARWDLAVAT